MNPETRVLLRVNVDDRVEANEIFSTLMGDAFDPRREIIKRNASTSPRSISDRRVFVGSCIIREIMRVT